MYMIKAIILAFSFAASVDSVAISTSCPYEFTRLCVLTSTDPTSCAEDSRYVTETSQCEYVPPSDTCDLQGWSEICYREVPAGHQDDPVPYCIDQLAVHVQFSKQPDQCRRQVIFGGDENNGWDGGSFG